MAADVPHRYATRSWPKALGSRLYGSLSTRFGIKHCSAHGLRKAGATIAADNGATAHELMAIFGWETLRQAEVDTRQADRKRLADRAMHLVVPRDEEREDNQNVPLSGGEGSGTNKGA